MQGYLSKNSIIITGGGDGGDDRTTAFNAIPSSYSDWMYQSFFSFLKREEDSFGVSAEKEKHTEKQQSSNDSFSSGSSYPLHLSTEEHHRLFLPSSPADHSNKHKCHSPILYHGKFASVRSTLDYTYHSHYTKTRQLLQDDVIEMFLNQTMVVDVNNGNVCTTPKGNNWIVFTAGAMGAGKSYTIKHLHTTNRFPLNSFVSVDPDEIRRHLPEFHLYARHTPQSAGEKTRKEAGYISEILTLVSLEKGYNVLVDGSLRDWGWYREYFELLRGSYSSLRIGILHIMAPREAVFARAESRSKITGRIVPRQTIELALEQVPKSVQILGPLADFFAELNNSPEKLDIELVTDGLSWDDFTRQWAQTCERKEEEDSVVGKEEEEQKAQTCNGDDGGRQIRRQRTEQQQEEGQHRHDWNKMDYESIQDAKLRSKL